MAFAAEHLDTPTGARLRLHVSEAPQARGVVQICHGLAEHAARYARFAAFLADRGYHVLAHDHRGHGETRAPGAPLGRFAANGGADAVVADAAAVLDHAARLYPGLPIIAFGHSMGGLVTCNLVQRHADRLAAAAIWNSNVSAGLPARAALAVLAWERFRLGSDVPSHLLPRLTFGAWGSAIADRRTEFDWLSHDEAEVAAYVADPLCGWNASVSLWRDLFELIFRAADTKRWSGVRRDLPLQLVGGDEDPATDGGKAVTGFARSLQATGFSNLETRIYAGTRHESLNELNRNIIMADFADWADAAIGSR